jgi:hypothetical protein
VPLSAVDCVQPAIQHTRDQLFARFRFGQWARLALVGILAAELHSGGCSVPNLGQFNAQRRGGNGFVSFPMPPHIDPARLGQYLGLIAAIVLLGAVLFFVFLYINSIFRFILFESVLNQECSIGDGWQRWHRAGRRFFLWQLVFQVAFGIFFATLVGIPLALAAAAGWFKDPKQHIGGMIGVVMLLVGAILIFALIAAAVQMLAKDFLVPIMALEGLDFADGWSRLLAMMRLEPGKYVVYVLLKIVLLIAAGIIFSILAIGPAIVVGIPAVVLFFMGKAAGLGWNVFTISLAIIFGTVFLLILIYLIALVSVPATVFFPAYSIYFFASRYPNLDVLLHPAPVTPAPELPPVPEMPPPPEPPPLPPTPEPIG